MKRQRFNLIIDDYILQVIIHKTSLVKCLDWQITYPRKEQIFKPSPGWKNIRLLLQVGEYQWFTPTRRIHRQRVKRPRVKRQRVKRHRVKRPRVKRQGVKNAIKGQTTQGQTTKSQKCDKRANFFLILTVSIFLLLFKVRLGTFWAERCA